MPMAVTRVPGTALPIRFLRVSTEKEEEMEMESTTKQIAKSNDNYSNKKKKQTNKQTNKQKQSHPVQSHPQPYPYLSTTRSKCRGSSPAGTASGLSCSFNTDNVRERRGQAEKR
jgi:hypothetical protein